MGHAMLKIRNNGAGRELWLERRFDILAETLGFDLLATPSLAPVLNQIRDGSSIKAAQVYTQLFDCPLSEAMVAVEALTSRLGRA